MVDKELRPKTKDEFLELLKWGVMAFGFKLVWDMLRDSTREQRPPDWERELVDEYYAGRLHGVGPRQRDLAERFQISQQETSRTIGEVRCEMWDEWNEDDAELSYKREVNRVAKLVGLRPQTVDSIVQLNEGCPNTDARQGKLL